MVAVLEVLSPSNKGLGNRFDEEKHLRKREAFLEAGVQLLEIDALLQGYRDVPRALADALSPYARVAWTATHANGRRTYRGWGWNDTDPLPAVPWPIDDAVDVCVDLSESAVQAFDFNRWDDLIDRTGTARGGR